MRAWKLGVRFRAPPSVITPTTTPTPVSAPTTSAPATTTTVEWNPMLVAGMSMRWRIFDDDTPQNFVLVRPRNGHVLAARVNKHGSTRSTEKAVGWRMMKDKRRGVSRVVLIPTNAPRSKIFWVLDEASSNPGLSLTWRRANNEMLWVSNHNNPPNPKP